jgi:phage repressor protein C with HTH and peptisase S24 domain
MTQRELAAKVGIKQPTLSELETGESAGTTNLASIAAALGVSALWLETGKGDSTVRADELTSPTRTLPDAVPVGVLDEIDPNVVDITLVKLRLSAGIMGYMAEPEQGVLRRIRMERAWLEQQGLFAENLIAVRVKGDSMSPRIEEGDIVVLNTADRRPAEGVAFAANLEGESVIKRMSRRLGRWYLVSDNIDQKRYPPQVCEGDRCILVGRVVHLHRDGNRI